MKEKFLEAEKKVHGHKAQLIDGATNVSVKGKQKSTPKPSQGAAAARVVIKTSRSEATGAKKTAVTKVAVAKAKEKSPAPPPTSASKETAANGKEAEAKKAVAGVASNSKRKLVPSRGQARAKTPTVTGAGLENDKRMRRKLIQALRVRPMTLKGLGKELGGVNANTLVPTLQLVAEFKAPGMYHLKSEYLDASMDESDSDEQQTSQQDEKQRGAEEQPSRKRVKVKDTNEGDAAGSSKGRQKSKLHTNSTAGEGNKTKPGLASTIEEEIEAAGEEAEFYAKYENFKVGMGCLCIKSIFSSRSSDSSLLFQVRGRAPISDKAMLELYITEFSDILIVYMKLYKVPTCHRCLGEDGDHSVCGFEQGCIFLVGTGRKRQRVSQTVQAKGYASGELFRT